MVARSCHHRDVTALRSSKVLILLMLWPCSGADAVRAQTWPATKLVASGTIGSHRLRWEIAGGPALEVATPGERERQRGVLAVPSFSVALASWFEIVVEGHAARYVAPVPGHVLGVVPIGWRIHAPGRTQPYLSAGAGLVWTNLTELTGVERRRNFLTQIGVGLRHVRPSGSALSVEARFFHLSNLGAVRPNLGIEVFAVLVGYRFQM
jgi:hypothetical protein